MHNSIGFRKNNSNNSNNNNNQKLTVNINNSLVTPIIKNETVSVYIFEFIKYREYSKNIDLDIQDKNVKIWTGVANSLLFIPKILIVLYLTS